MSKKITVLFVLLVAVVAITMLYALGPIDLKYGIGDAASTLRTGLFNAFGGITDAFKTLPNWPAIGIGLGILCGYLMGHYFQVAWLRLKWWGHDETMQQVYPSGPPMYQTPQAVPVQPPPPTVKPEEQTT